MLDLQTTVGNIAVCSWVRALQRQPAAGGGVVIGVHLTPAQIATAHRFYAANRARYSATLISDIQKAVGRPSTGVVDDETIRAVADKQDEFGPPLVPDGMAGSRTLARLFPTGLAGGDTAKRFIASVKEVVAPEEWAKLGTPQARAERLLDLASVQLASARVSVAPTAVAVNDLGPEALTLRGTWEVRFDIGKNHLDQPSISDEDARRLAAGVYHEARHIEQFHKMARMLAAKEPKPSPEQIAARMQIPVDVARDARDDPAAEGHDGVPHRRGPVRRNLRRGEAT